MEIPEKENNRISILNIIKIKQYNTYRFEKSFQNYDKNAP